MGHLGGVRSGGEQASRAGMRVEAAEWAGATATRTGGGRRRGTAGRRYRLCPRCRRRRGSARSLAEAGRIGPSAGPASGFGPRRSSNLAMSDVCGTWYSVLPCSVRAGPPSMTAFIDSARERYARHFPAAVSSPGCATKDPVLASHLHALRYESRKRTCCTLGSSYRRGKGAWLSFESDRCCATFRRTKGFRLLIQ